MKRLHLSMKTCEIPTTTLVRSAWAFVLMSDISDANCSVACRFQAVSCLCPLRDVGFDASTSQGRSFVVTGGHGSLAPFMMQVLKAWGADVCCVTTKSQV